MPLPPLVALFSRLGAEAACASGPGGGGAISGVVSDGPGATPAPLASPIVLNSIPAVRRRAKGVAQLYRHACVTSTDTRQTSAVYPEANAIVLCGARAPAPLLAEGDVLLFIQVPHIERLVLLQARVQQLSAVRPASNHLLQCAGSVKREHSMQSKLLKRTHHCVGVGDLGDVALLRQVAQQREDLGDGVAAVGSALGFGGFVRQRRL